MRLLIRATGAWEKNEASCCGITLGQCHILIEIGRNNELPLNELANILNLDKSTVSRAVDNLVKNNLVIRKTNSADRRYLGLVLSSEGNEIYNEIEKNMNETFAEVLNLIPENKQIQVVESIQLLLNALNNKKNMCC